MLKINILILKIYNKMNALDNDLAKQVTVNNELGLHARPAAMIAKCAMKARSSVWMIKNGEHVDASSIIDILSLACAKGNNITLKVESESDLSVLEELIALFEKGFNE